MDSEKALVKSTCKFSYQAHVISATATSNSVTSTAATSNSFVSDTATSVGGGGGAQYKNLKKWGESQPRPLPPPILNRSIKAVG